MTIAGKIAHYVAYDRESGQQQRSAAIDSKTALWCGRMLIGEGWKDGGGSAVLWSTMYRFLGMPHNWGSYLNLIRLFSQPINEKWLPGGQLFEKYKNSKKAVYQRATSDAAVARRRRIQSTEWADLPIKVQQIVGQFAIGQLKPPPEFGGRPFSNFASYKGVETKYPGGVWIGGNYFFVDPALKQNWELVVERGKGTPIRETKKKSGGVADIALLGAALYVVWQFIAKGR